jgi:hypothetical protein
MAITTISKSVSARLSTTKPASPSAGLDPARLTEKVSSKTCQIFDPPKLDKNGKLTAGRALKGSCPITWAWKDGEPALRFCHGKGKPGRIIPVTDAEDAMQKAWKLCATWREKRQGVERDEKGMSPQFSVRALEMSDTLTEYTLGRVKSRRAPQRRRPRQR